MPGAFDPDTSVLVALIAGLATIVSPALVALINRGGRSKDTKPKVNIDLTADLDELNDHLARELRQVRLERDHAVRRAEAAEARLREERP